VAVVRRVVHAIGFAAAVVYEAIQLIRFAARIAR